MTNEQQQIKECMRLAEQATPDRPTMPDRDVRKLRLNLIAEELSELAEAFGFDSTGSFTPNNQPCDMVAAYDAVIDLLVVVIGTAVAMGVELEPGWQEVHKSNIAKFPAGVYKRSDGKFLKPPGWQPPALKPILDQQSSKPPA